MYDYCDNDSMRDTLRHNLGSVCTIYTEPGERACGFTGVLSEVSRSTCKLITVNSYNSRNGCCNNPRRVRTIPIDKICCLESTRY